MKRMTRVFDCEKPRCVALRDGRYSQRWNEKEDVGKALLRLAAYEDTGLEPEELMELLSEKSSWKVASELLGVSSDRLQALIHAERDGRLVVLPCDGSEDTALLVSRNNETEIVNVRVCGDADDALVLLSYLAHFIATELGTTYKKLLLSMGNRPSIVEVAETGAAPEQTKEAGT